jgi:hypothetical protein
MYIIFPLEVIEHKRKLFENGRGGYLFRCSKWKLEKTFSATVVATSDSGTSTGGVTD